jgi:hypothetical protein
MPQVSYCEAAQADKDTDTDAGLVMQLRAGDESAGMIREAPTRALIP